MKKCLAFTLLALLPIIGTCLACTSTPKDFVSFENTQLGYKIQYPEGYVFIEDSMTGDEKTVALSNLPENMHDQVPSSIQAIWFIPDSGQFSANTISLYISSVSDATQQSLKSKPTQEQYESDVVEQYSGIFSDFTISKHMEGGTFGSQYFIMYNCAYKNYDVQYYMAQAITIWKGNQYTFTFTSNNPNLFTTAPFTTMLCTLKFTK